MQTRSIRLNCAYGTQTAAAAGNVPGSLRICGLKRCLEQSLVLSSLGICFLACTKYRIPQRRLGISAKQQAVDLVEGIERRQSGRFLSNRIQRLPRHTFCSEHSRVRPRSGFLAAARPAGLLLGLRRRRLRRHWHVRLHERYVELPAVPIDPAPHFRISRELADSPALKAGLSFLRMLQTSWFLPDINTGATWSISLLTVAP